MSALDSDPWQPTSDVGPVLIADDSAVLRAILRSELTTHGWNVEEARDGVEALERCRELHPHIVLLDIEMPRMNGYQVLAAICADPVLSETPVIFLTARDSGGEVAEGLRRGAHDYLRKPFESSELLARLLVADRTRRLRDELRRRSVELERLAMTDTLTGLHNRRSIQQQLAGYVALACRHGHTFSLLMVDVDHFKNVNDTLGHEAGDSVLREIAIRLQTRTRESDAIGRWGGEEFLVILPETDADGAVSIAKDLLEVASEPIPLSGYQPTQLTISIGAAEWNDNNPTSLVHQADQALYQAKLAGRNTVHVAQPSRSDSALAASQDQSENA